MATQTTNQFCLVCGQHAPCETHTFHGVIQDKSKTTNVIDLADARGRQFFKNIPDHLKPYALEHVKWCKLWANDSLEAAAGVAEAWKGDFASLAATIRSFKYEV